jgi:hypothetical protein
LFSLAGKEDNIRRELPREPTPPATPNSDSWNKKQGGEFMHHTWNTVFVILAIATTFAGSLLWATRGHSADADTEEQDTGKTGKNS